MKRIILFVCVLGFLFFLKAQNYPLAKHNATWEYLHTSLSSYSRYCNVVDGDTTANGRIYKKMYYYSTYWYDRMNAKFACAFREEGDKIYALPDENNQYLPKKDDEVVLYDFSLKEGDVVYLESGRDNGYTVDKVEYVDIEGKQCKRISTRGVLAGTTVIGNMPKGVYYYRLEKTGGIPENGKFIVQ